LRGLSRALSRKSFKRAKKKYPLSDKKTYAKWRAEGIGRRGHSLVTPRMGRYDPRVDPGYVFSEKEEETESPNEKEGSEKK